MKIINSLLAVIISLSMTTPLMAQEADVDGAKITFESETIDYGTIEQGADGNRVFKFTNSGNEPLIITNCKGSCGCTVPQCPKEPVLSGESDSIKVKYDTKRIGSFTKTVTLTSNDTEAGTRVLKIKGTVVAKPAE